MKAAIKMGTSLAIKMVRPIFMVQAALIWVEWAPESMVMAIEMDTSMVILMAMPIDTTLATKAITTTVEMLITTTVEIPT